MAHAAESQPYAPPTGWSQPDLVGQRPRVLQVQRTSVFTRRALSSAGSWDYDTPRMHRVTRQEDLDRASAAAAGDALPIGGRPPAQDSAPRGTS